MLSLPCLKESPSWLVLWLAYFREVHLIDFNFFETLILPRSAPWTTAQTLLWFMVDRYHSASHFSRHTDVFINPKISGLYTLFYSLQFPLLCVPKKMDSWLKHTPIRRFLLVEASTSVPDDAARCWVSAWLDFFPSFKEIAFKYCSSDAGRVLAVVIYLSSTCWASLKWHLEPSLEDWQ